MAAIHSKLHLFGNNNMLQHALPKITQAKLLGAYTLKITFDDGLVRVIDFVDILQGPIYEPLQDTHLFAQVQIDPETHTLVWPNGADFDPETLYNWPDYVDSLKAMAKRWAQRQKQAA